MPRITFDSLKEEIHDLVLEVEDVDVQRVTYKLLELISWQQVEIQALTDEIKILKQKKGKDENPKTDD